jgi:hypothetical protein
MSELLPGESGLDRLTAYRFVMRSNDTQHPLGR